MDIISKLENALKVLTVKKEPLMVKDLIQLLSETREIIVSGLSKSAKTNILLKAESIVRGEGTELKLFKEKVEQVSKRNKALEDTVNTFNALKEDMSKQVKGLTMLAHPNDVDLRSILISNAESMNIKELVETKNNLKRVLSEKFDVGNKVLTLTKKENGIEVNTNNFKIGDT